MTDTEHFHPRNLTFSQAQGYEALPGPLAEDARRSPRNFSYKGIVLFFAFTTISRRLQVAESLPGARWKQTSRHPFVHIVVPDFLVCGDTNEANSSVQTLEGSQGNMPDGS